jgi:GNAT superfamily N-acetyltransferase
MESADRAASEDTYTMSDLAISLVIAGIGSLITWAAARLSRNVRNHRLRKRYPVAGRFLTTYEDSDRASGEVDVRKAITKL